THLSSSSRSPTYNGDGLREVIGGEQNGKGGGALRDRGVKPKKNQAFAIQESEGSVRDADYNSRVGDINAVALDHRDTVPIRL
ncbi:MAG: hypothetical protein J6X31_05565, partial [Bacteroidales bacterium]|nr:hypothetical protein [Bacteroidales bacterium]